MTGPHRKPQAFRLEAEAPAHPPRRKPQVDVEIEAGLEPQLPATAAMASAHGTRKGMPWGYVFLTSLLALFSLWLAVTATTMVQTFFTWSMTLGWVSTALAALAGFAGLMIVLRELWAFARLRQIEHLQILSARAVNQSDAAAARAAVAGLKQIYARRPDLSWALQNLAQHEGEIIDPPGLIRIAERELLEPLDEQARRIITRRARRVTLLSTVTPTAALDVLVVGAQNIFMIREIAEIYGGRPTFLTTLRLARMVVAHLAVTAGLALSENVMHLAIGKGLLGRLSARLGEGAINGTLSTRLGLAACDVCRPVSFASDRRESLTSMLRELLRWQGGEAGNVKD